MPKPTLDHITAADGTRITITTRVDGFGVVHVALFRDPDKSTALARAEFTAAPAPVVHYVRNADASVTSAACGVGVRTRDLGPDRVRYAEARQYVTCPACVAAMARLAVAVQS
jgi:hypothetical protein